MTLKLWHSAEICQNAKTGLSGALTGGCADQDDLEFGGFTVQLAIRSTENNILPLSMTVIPKPISHITFYQYLTNI